MDNLSDVMVFVRVVELSSFTAAADELQLSKAVVSKYVTRLEERLGARLLNRTTRRLTLTEAGTALYRRSAEALGEIRQAEEEVAQLAGEPRGHLRISAPIYFGSVMLAPLLPEFMSRYPAITFDLDLNDRMIDLVKDRIDLAVRISELADSSLVARKIAPCPLIVVGSPEYLKRHGTPQTPTDLVHHHCLSYSLLRAPNEWRFRTPKGRWISVTVRGPIRCNNDATLKQCVLDGLGLRQLPRLLVAHELAQGTLVEVLKDY
ncbi:MAG: LysR family transcriptional regulator [Gammaproteobacteria bacterium]